MAIIASTEAPYTQGAAPEATVGTPAFIASRFPVPPPIIGFLTDLDVGSEFSYDAVFGTGYLTGALYPEATHLEPTIGQIWPR